MTEIRLGFGSDSVKFVFADDQFQLLTSEAAQPPPLTDVEINDQLSSPIASPTIEESFSSGDTVLIVVSDATRATASGQILNLLVRRLIQEGVSPAEIAIIFSTGIHRPVTAEEKIKLLTPFIAQRIRTLDHFASDPAALVSLGTTARNTPVELNGALRSFSKVITTGGINFQYFAGFTGGRKSVCPGLASARTIAATHMLAMDFETGERRAGVGVGRLEGNAVSEECERVAEFVEPSWGINAVVDNQGRAVRIYAGDWRASHRNACADYLAQHAIAIDQKRDLVVVSCGGDPYDINLIQAHKSMEMAAQATNEGGTIVLLAECSDGLGRPDFLKWFAAANSRELARQLRDSYEVNGQTAWSLMTKTEKFRVILVSKLPADDVRLMRMLPAASLDEAMQIVDSARVGYVMPHGARFLPQARHRPLD
jgi:lactate racemase